MMNMLWKLAQVLAKEKYKEEIDCSWEDVEYSWEEDIDKYEREDRVYSMYEKIKKDTDNLRTNNLKMIEGEWYMRDPKTERFCKVTENTTINNNLNNEKENKTMMNNKMNAKERRMETLKENGINTDNFFDLSLRIPLNAEVKITVNGKEMTIGQPQFKSGISTGGDVDLHNNFDVNLYGKFDVDLLSKEIKNRNIDLCGVNPINVEKDNLLNDEIAKNIIEYGYVRNTKLFRRWITAHTFRMLNYKSYRDPNRTGWECCMKDCYDYNYQFKMLLEEMRVLSILQKEDTEVFEERIRFFNGDVVLTTLNDYEYRLKKYIEKCRREKKRMHKRQEYVKLAKYSDVYVKDLEKNVYSVINHYIGNIEAAVNSGNYKRIYITLKEFMDVAYNKLPYETTKCPEWKDAFKAIGAFETLKNLIRWHEVLLEGCTNKYDSEEKLYELLDKYKGQEWRLHKVLVDTIKLNNFDLRKSIAEGHNAEGTSVDRRWKRHECR